MKPVREPKDNYYTVPRDLPKEHLHYIMVQVSKRKYVVAEFASSGRGFTYVPEFVVVSDPLSEYEANQLAQQLTRQRTEKEIPDAPKH